MTPNDSRITRPLVVGIDARAAVETKAGRGRLVRELLRTLAERDDANTYRCYCRSPWQPLDASFEWVPVRGPDPLWHARVSAAASRECDVFLSTNSYLTAIMVRVPSVTIVHDLMALDPGTQPNRRSAIVERLTLRAAVRESERLWCTTQSTAAQLLARYPHARNKIGVVPLAVSPRLSSGFVDGGSGLPNSGFVLAVGTLEPRKNLPRLVEAYASLPSALREAHPLVVVGARGWRTAATLESLRSLGEQCRMLDHVSDEELAELYRRCAVFCYPSLGEGFGLPVLEAMAAGAPVVTSNVSSLPEVGGDAVEYVDPRSAQSIATGLARLLESPERRAELASRGRARAAGFSWDATTSAVVELLQAAMADRAAWHR
jgi:glycosyltransferase involved in cell wall biosynthesis